MTSDEKLHAVSIAFAALQRNATRQNEALIEWVGYIIDAIEDGDIDDAHTGLVVLRSTLANKEP